MLVTTNQIMTFDAFDIIKAEADYALSSDNPFLKNGTVGVALCACEMYRSTADQRYFDLASDLLSGLDLSMSGRLRLEIPVGITGIALAMTLLHRRGAIAGSLNDVLRHIDDTIYRNVMNHLDNPKAEKVREYESTLLDVAVYTAIRITSTELPPVEREIRTRLLARIVDSVYFSVSRDFFAEPLPPSVTSYKLVKFIVAIALGMRVEECRQRMLHILDECGALILGQMPFMGYNRLALYSALACLSSNVGLTPCWYSYIDTLRRGIDVERIVNCEIAPNEISLTAGLAGLCFMLRNLPRRFRIDVPARVLRSSLESSRLFTAGSEGRYSADEEFHGLDGRLAALYEHHLLTLKLR